MIRQTISPNQYQALGESEAFLTLQERISRAGKTSRPVIFVGERGTGKELAAARLHLLSPRWNQAYVTLNCASLAPTLIESELFGHEAGAFTGAARQRKGRFEIAHDGSLFLDEVANIPMNVQEKILRVVEYGKMERVGSSTTLEVDVRLIAATNADLKRMAREGKFREDLLDRLSFEVIVLPPLRERSDDIMLLATHFARRMANELEREKMPEFTPEAERALREYPWPGNVRELKNVVERMVYRASEAKIKEIVFDPFESCFMPEDEPHGEPAMVGTVASGNSGGGDPDGDGEQAASSTPTRRAEKSGAGDLESLPLDEAIRLLEIRRIRAALEANQFNQRKAAEQLGLTYHQFRGYYRKYRDELTNQPAEKSA